MLGRARSPVLFTASTTSPASSNSVLTGLNEDPGLFVRAPTMHDVRTSETSDSASNSADETAGRYVPPSHRRDVRTSGLSETSESLRPRSFPGAQTSRLFPRLAIASLHSYGSGRLPFERRVVGARPRDGRDVRAPGEDFPSQGSGLASLLGHVPSGRRAAKAEPSASSASRRSPGNGATNSR